MIVDAQSAAVAVFPVPGVPVIRMLGILRPLEFVVVGAPTAADAPAWFCVRDAIELDEEGAKKQ